MGKKKKEEKKEKAKKKEHAPVGPSDVSGAIVQAARAIRTVLSRNLLSSGLYAGQDGVMLALADNGGMTAGLKVSIFLTSAAVDLVRKRSIEMTRVEPMEPLAALVQDFLRRGGQLWACTPCVKARGYGEQDLIDGVVVTGASKMHERILAGAATLSF